MVPSSMAALRSVAQLPTQSIASSATAGGETTRLFAFLLAQLPRGLRQTSREGARQRIPSHEIFPDLQRTSELVPNVRSDRHSRRAQCNLLVVFVRGRETTRRGNG